MPRVDNHVHLNPRAGTPGLSRPLAANQHAHAGQPNALAVTPKLADGLAMRWSTGPDGLLYCTWHRPTLCNIDQTEGAFGWPRAGLAA